MRFKVDSVTPNALWAIETTDSSRRFAIDARYGKLAVQYNNGSGWRYPVDLITALQANTWYVANILLDDVRGFYVEVYQQSAPTVRGSYQQEMPTGLAWRFRHWIYSGNAYLDDYSEFNASYLTWQNDERMNFGYDALNRLSSATPDSGAQGYNQTYQYTAIGNLAYKSDVGSYTYPPSGSGSVRPHAATAAGANAYSYDANGNMLTRTENGVTYTQTWDEENRLKTVTVNGQTTTYTYDGNGQRVKKVQGGQTTVYVGNYYEKNLTTGVVTTYYYAGGQRVAQRQATSTVYYFVSDQLGSTSLTTNASGGEAGRQRYYPFGAPRSQSGALNTDYRFTGQRSEETNLGSLYDYGGRFYSPLLGRFLSADSLVPQPGDPPSLNRYSYVRNNPLILVDPSGMADCAVDDRACWEDEWNWKNRWHNAHGYGWDGDHWGNRIDARFQDEGILRETMGELGIYFTADAGTPWTLLQASLVAQGVVALANKIGSFAQLHNLLPTVTIFMHATHALFYYYDQSLDPPAHTIPGGNLVVFANDLFQGANDYVRGTAVHELAHVIDYFNPIGGSVYPHQAVPRGTHISDYAVENRFGLEYWAEAVAVWVYGARYQSTVPDPRKNQPLTVNQSSWIEHVLKGWG